MHLPALQNVIALAGHALRGQAVNQPPEVMSDLWQCLGQVTKDYQALKDDAAKAAGPPVEYPQG